MDPTRVWVVSDVHLGDAWAAKMRFCRSAADMETVMRDKWFRDVAPTDFVINLGDLGELDRATDWFATLPGIKFLVAGNNEDATDELFGHTVRMPGKSPEMGGIFDGVEVRFSHYPYGNRRAPHDEGIPLIHGHTHAYPKTSRSEKGTPMINACWEARRKMVRMDVLMAEIEAMNNG